MALAWDLDQAETDVLGERARRTFFEVLLCGPLIVRAAVGQSVASAVSTGQDAEGEENDSDELYSVCRH